MNFIFIILLCAIVLAGIGYAKLAKSFFFITLVVATSLLIYYSIV